MSNESKHQPSVELDFLLFRCVCGFQQRPPPPGHASHVVRDNEHKKQKLVNEKLWNFAALILIWILYKKNHNHMRFVCLRLLYSWYERTVREYVRGESNFFRVLLTAGFITDNNPKRALYYTHGKHSYLNIFIIFKCSFSAQTFCSILLSTATPVRFMLRQ